MKKLLAVSLLASTLVAGSAFAISESGSALTSQVVKALSSSVAALDIGPKNLSVSFENGKSVSGKIVFEREMTDKQFSVASAKALANLQKVQPESNWTIVIAKDGKSEMFKNTIGEPATIVLHSSADTISWKQAAGMANNLQ